MTIDQLLPLSADEWDKLTDAELEALCAPFYKETRRALPKQQVKQAERMLARLTKEKTDKALEDFEKNFLQMPK